MALRGTSIAAALGLLVCALPTVALADQTGNASNNPAVIQGLIPEETGSIGTRHHPMRTSEPIVHSQTQKCGFLGEEAGNRNPDYVQCFKN